MEALPGEKLIFYSIGFVNDPKLMDEFENYEPPLVQFAGLKTLKEPTVKFVSEFLDKTIAEQRALFASKSKEDKKLLESYIRSICDIIRNIVSDAKFVKYFILLLDGMIEGKSLNYKK
jgi:hypothetical protein